MTFRGKPIMDALSDRYVFELDYDTETMIFSLVLYDVWYLTEKNYMICNYKDLLSINKDLKIAVRCCLVSFQIRLKNYYGIELDHPKEGYAWLEKAIIDIVAEINIRRYARRG